MKQKRKRFLALLNILGFAGVLVVNTLANALPLNGQTTGEISNRYPNLFVPVGLTFSIWGIIYLLLGIFTVFQAIRAFGKDRDAVHRIGVLFFLSCAANAGWIFAWHFGLIFLSLVLMLVLLASLLGIYLRLGVGKRSAPPVERYLVHMPFSVYLGWITVATIANVTVLLVSIGWTRFGLSEEFWTILVIGAGALLALAGVFYRGDVFYALVIVWALAGILLRHMPPPLTGVNLTVICGLSLVALSILVRSLGGGVYHSV